ncbi:Pentatricopeptide repeat-containing protein [Camellia lanceoleosa]|uniref:Pentatricopeptide repeat-containing protein n=1 Tax=Camellia lanceoleosa TaxID=1840588 RepID=A0ACC0I9T3_9ERIC|nr:Pentatricopeptide repeat-containing protein [Camellia lanceoleosa]
MQIASFIKTHIFSRRRPIDGWKHMIEEIGPNAKKGKGSVSRLPSLSDASTQPFKEEKSHITSRITSYKGRFVPQLRRAGLRTGVSTVLSALTAFGNLGFVLGGESLHGYSIKTGFLLDVNVVTALISMYGKIGLIDSGRRVFNEVSVHDIVLWNCLIDGYAKNGLLEESLALLRLMKCEQLKPNSSTLAGLLSACAASGALALGQCAYDYVEEDRLVLMRFLARLW